MQLPRQSALNFLQITGPCFTSYAHPNSPTFSSLFFPLGSTCFISFSLLYVYLYVISSSYFLPLSFFSRLSLSSHLWNKSRSSEHKGKLPSTSFMARRFIASFSFSGSPWIVAPEENDQRCRNRKNIAKGKLKGNRWQGKGKSSMTTARIVF